MLIKVVFIGFIVLICGGLVKEYVSYFGTIVSILGIILICGITLPYINSIYIKITSYFDSLKLDSGLFKPLFKVVFISIITKISSEICKDRGERALGLKIELAGLIAGLICSFPLLDKALSLIGGI